MSELEWELADVALVDLAHETVLWEGRPSGQLLAAQSIAVAMAAVAVAAAAATWLVALAALTGALSTGLLLLGALALAVPVGLISLWLVLYGRMQMKQRFLVTDRRAIVVGAEHIVSRRNRAESFGLEILKRRQVRPGWFGAGDLVFSESWDTSRGEPRHVRKGFLAVADVLQAEAAIQAALEPSRTTYRKEPPQGWGSSRALEAGETLL